VVANYHNFADIYRKRNKNMRRVRLTEGQLHRIIRNAVNEAIEDDMSGNEDIEERRNLIVLRLIKEGYDVSCYHQDPNKFIVYLEGWRYGVHNDEAQKIASDLKDRFNLKKTRLNFAGFNELWQERYKQMHKHWLDAYETLTIECSL
jgi:hypothetical protein